MNNASIRQLAKSKLSKNWGSALAILIIMALVFGLGELIQAALTPGLSLQALQKFIQYGDMSDFILNEPKRTSLTTVVGLVFGLIHFLLRTGASWGYIHMIDSGQLQFESLTWAFKYLGTLILLFLWTSLWIILWAIPFAISVVFAGMAADADSPILALVLFLVALAFVVNLFIRSMLYSQAPLVLYDSPGMDVRDALSLSIGRMQGRVGQYFCLELSYEFPLILVSLAALTFIYAAAKKTAEFMITGQIQAGRLISLGGIGLAVTLLVGLAFWLVIVPRRNAGRAAFYTLLIRSPGQAKSRDQEGERDAF